MKKKIKLFKYVGETARSVYERSWEHVNSRDQLQTSSHMLKHILEEHEEEEQMEKIIFGVKVLRYTRNAFERQVSESVLIQEQRGHNILNSKSEYNRCSLPRLTANLGNREWRKRQKEEREEKEKNDALERRIIGMRKNRNKGRRGETTLRDEPAEKRRKIGNAEWKRVLQVKWGGEKRKKTTRRTMSMYTQQRGGEKTTSETIWEKKQEKKMQKRSQKRTKLMRM